MLRVTAAALRSARLRAPAVSSVSLVSGSRPLATAAAPSVAPQSDDLAALLHTAAALMDASAVSAADTTDGGTTSSTTSTDGAGPGATAATSSATDVAAADDADPLPEAVDLACLKPREIVKELDKFIIGQEAAKKAISIALRNRWRRLRLPEELQAEIIPKNILMVGPTGVGKTEIARRLAKLANSPFVKVEATKFTEVGFHGRDVDTIIRDLMEASLQLTKQLKTEQFRDEIKPRVERLILEAMTGPEAREDTVAGFRRLLEAGELDDREITIDLPVRTGMPPELEMNVQGASFDLGEFMSRLGGGPSKPRLAKKKVKVKDCWSVLMEHELDKKLSTLDIRKEAVELAEQNGIVFIDEIDKIVSKSHKYSSDASSEGVQRDLLPLIEGCTVDVKRFGPVKTDYILFVASGAFHEAKPADMLAELQGRLPIRVELNPLTVADLRRILTEPQSNLIEQQKALISAEDVNVEFDDDSIDTIAELAADINSTVENIGARRLHTVLERIMEDISYEAPDMAEGSVVTVDAALVQQKVGDMLKRQDLSKFIL